MRTSMSLPSASSCWKDSTGLWQLLSTATAMVATLQHKEAAIEPQDFVCHHHSWNLFVSMSKYNILQVVGMVIQSGLQLTLFIN